MPKRSKPPLLQIGSALALMLVLAGCTKGGQFDPTELLNSDAFDTKKKLKGDREAVFPNGVPGTTTGVPADLVKGYQPPPDQPDSASIPPAPPQEAAAKPKAKPKPKLAVAPASKPTRISVGSAPNAGASATPWPAPQTSAAPAAQAPWPAPPQTAPGQQAGQGSQSVWPNPPAPAKPPQ